MYRRVNRPIRREFTAKYKIATQINSKRVSPCAIYPISKSGMVYIRSNYVIGAIRVCKASRNAAETKNLEYKKIQRKKSISFAVDDKICFEIARKKRFHCYRYSDCYCYYLVTTIIYMCLTLLWRIISSLRRHTELFKKFSVFLFSFFKPFFFFQQEFF